MWSSRVKVILSGYSLESLIDTGAAISVMQLATYQTGTLLDVVGATDISIDGLDAPITVIIVRNLQEQLILGCNVLANTLIDLSRGIVRIDGKTWPIMKSRQSDNHVYVILPATGNVRFN